MPDPLLKLAILVSGAGTTLQNLIDEIAGGRLVAEIAIVIGSRPDLIGLERAKLAGIRSVVVDRKTFASSIDFNEAVFRQVLSAQPDLVCLAGWLCLLHIPIAYQGRVMNIHPALLPGFGGKGMFGQKVHQAVIDHGCKVSGCTVHFVDDAYDNGPIILQRVCVVEETDTAQILSQRVFEEEKLAYPQAIRLFQQRRLSIQGRRVQVKT